MKTIILAATAALFATTAYAADPVQPMPTPYTAKSEDCRPVLFGRGCARYDDHVGTGQTPDRQATPAPSRPDPSRPTPEPEQPEEPEPEVPTKPEKPDRPDKPGKPGHGYDKPGHHGKPGRGGHNNGRGHGFGQHDRGWNR